ncbi:MAG TPA: sulfite exporter TauE/SafE family protein [Candidatus Krumholzibacteria bacterium]|nr:sulfite exporter TauE/SafE family protein [Candidatus Krumholzibacteria bacterium]
MHFFFAGLLAFTAGTVFGIFGAGGSILLVPILVYVLHVPVKTSLGMSLFILMFTGIIAATAHARSRNVGWMIGIRWALAGIVGAYAGGRVAEFIPGGVLLTTFAVVVVVAALLMILRKAPPTSHDAEHVPALKGIVVGLILGFFTGMIGVGGGFLLVPALVLVCGLNVKRAIGTSLLIIAINSMGGFMGFAAHEAFPWKLTLIVTAFNSLGSLLGERLGKPLPAQRLRPAFGAFLLVVGTAMVLQNILGLFTKGH